MIGILKCAVICFSTTWAANPHVENSFKNSLQMLRACGFAVTDYGEPSPTGRSIIEQISSHGTEVKPQMFIVDDALDIVLAGHVELTGPALYLEWPAVYLVVGNTVIVPVHGEQSAWENLISKMNAHGARYVERKFSDPSRALQTLESLRREIQLWEKERGQFHFEEWRQWMTWDRESLVDNSLAHRAVATKFIVSDQPGLTGKNVNLRDAAWLWNQADEQIFPVGWTEEELRATVRMIDEKRLCRSMPPFSDRRRVPIKSMLGGWRAVIGGFHAKGGAEGQANFPSLEQVASGELLSPKSPSDRWTNPFNNSYEVQQMAWNADDPPVAGSAGWNYDPETGKLWANSNVTGENEF